MKQLADLRLFSTSAHPCSYLEGESARTLFIDPEASITKSQHTRLSELGFRRSGSHYYRPFCEQCQACLPCRVRVSEFSFSRSFRRILRLNQDVVVSRTNEIDTEEHYALYQRYIDERHDDGDMYPATPEQFRSFLVACCESTNYLEMRVQGRLIGLFVSDELDDGLSAVYTCFAPEESWRSPGTFAVLWQILQCQTLGLPHLYLGYWIRDCRKMRYKTRYQPLEVFSNGSWALLS